MLRLTLEPGDYFTINDDIVIQIHHIDGKRSHVAIKAPKEMPIVRGTVREREGAARPEGLIRTYRGPRKQVSPELI